MKKYISLVFVFLMFIFIFSCNKENKTLDNQYRSDDLWAFKETDENLDVDTFFLAPACATGSEKEPTLDYSSSKRMSQFEGSIKMEKGIYDEQTRFFAPYYHEALVYVSLLDDEEKKNKYLDEAYKEVKEAFEYYLYNYNKGNKIILAGFSEGALMCLRLLNDFINNDLFYNNYLACYAIGYLVEDSYLASSDKIKMAEGETDLKCIISFNTEAIDTTATFIVKENQKSNAINPLTWKRDTSVASKDLNKGAVFLNTYGEITKTLDNFTGCYIDSNRGTLKVTDVIKDDYNKLKDSFGDGCYHLYDYQFFYNNLKENVIKRINAKEQ
ncbi:MAG: DUF3089 domain-containing protein [Acholeplasmatales bacterium]|nr:DUF3089 domain-containing protein [Acholeplasmatales bacterium]